MGSYPSNKVPRLPKNFFAIVYSAPSNNSGDYWIMIARLDKTYSLLTKKYGRMASRNLQKTDTLCRVYAIHSAFLLFKSTEKLEY